MRPESHKSSPAYIIAGATAKPLHTLWWCTTGTGLVRENCLQLVAHCFLNALDFFLLFKALMHITAVLFYMSR